MAIGELISDWGGFERLIAELHKTGEVKVEHNVTLHGRSGAPRQIDVLVRHKQGLYEHLVVVECKYHKTPIERLHIDALATTVKEVGASRGVIFAMNGFQSGAITQAEHENIDLFTVRDLTDEEWGLPGQVVDLFLQVIQPSIGNLVVDGGMAIGNPTNGAPVYFNLEFGPHGPISSTRTLKKDGTPGGKDVEVYISETANQSMMEALGDPFTINRGEECTRYMGRPVNVQFSSPLTIPMNGAFVLIPKLSFHLGIKIMQSRITIDRAKQYKFALAVVNCINGNLSSAARPINGVETILEDIVTPRAKSDQLPLINGSIMRVILGGFFEFEEMRGLERIPDPRTRTDHVS
jgi:hypothetical protein